MAQHESTVLEVRHAATCTVSLRGGGRCAGGTHSAEPHACIPVREVAGRGSAVSERIDPLTVRPKKSAAQPSVIQDIREVLLTRLAERAQGGPPRLRTVGGADRKRRFGRAVVRQVWQVDAKHTAKGTVRVVGIRDHPRELK